MKTETKDQLRAKIEKLEGQVKNLKDQSRDKFTVTVNKDQFTFLMDKLWRDVSDMKDAMHKAEHGDDHHYFDGYPNLVLLQGACQAQSLYELFQRQTGTSWDFNVATQKVFMSDKGEL